MDSHIKSRDLLLLSDASSTEVRTLSSPKDPRSAYYSEHLGLIEPQDCSQPYPKVTSFMRPAPIPNEDETHLKEDRRVADPLAYQCDLLLKETARKNREAFMEFFRPVPSNLVRNWDAYDVCIHFQCPQAMD